jgi:hypothetical protein
VVVVLVVVGWTESRQLSTATAPSMPGVDGTQQKQPVSQLPETSTHAPIVQTKMHELGHGVVVVVVVVLVVVLEVVGGIVLIIHHPSRSC